MKPTGCHGKRSERSKNHLSKCVARNGKFRRGRYGDKYERREGVRLTAPRENSCGQFLSEDIFYRLESNSVVLISAYVKKSFYVYQ